jgi:hypothetical protein
MDLHITDAPLKSIFFTHFILTIWAIQGMWLPNSFLYYNLVFICILIWAMHSKDSEEPIQMALIINIVSILLDIVTVSIYGARVHSSVDIFGLLAFIVNLVARLLTSLGLYRIQTERSGGYNHYGVPGLPDYLGRRGPYDNVDQPASHTSPSTSSDVTTPYQQPPAYTPQKTYSSVP